MVRLRDIAVADAPAVAAAVKDSRPALSRWMAWYSDGYDLHAARRWIDAGIQFAIEDTGADLVGIVGFEDVNEQTARAMIGYWIVSGATGRGIGRRAVGLALDWARAQGRLRVVWAVVADANLASRRVLEVNGFRLVGTQGVDERGDTELLYERDLRE
jgi:RimJ/RimL family protein N-acetyltransferase